MLKIKEKTKQALSIIRAHYTTDPAVSFLSFAKVYKQMGISAQEFARVRSSKMYNEELTALGVVESHKPGQVRKSGYVQSEREHIEKRLLGRTVINGTQVQTTLSNDGKLWLLGYDVSRALSKPV